MRWENKYFLVIGARKECVPLMHITYQFLREVCKEPGQRVNGSASIVSLNNNLPALASYFSIQ